MNNKYFTPITELPGDSGKSESAAAMVRYNRSTSPHKYAQNQTKKPQKDEYFQKIITVEPNNNSLFTSIAPQHTIKKSATVASQNKYASQFTNKYAPQKSNVIAKSMSMPTKKTKKIKKLDWEDWQKTGKDTIEDFLKWIADLGNEYKIDVTGLRTGGSVPRTVGEEALRQMYGADAKIKIPSATTATTATTGTSPATTSYTPTVFTDFLDQIIKETNLAQGRPANAPFSGLPLYGAGGAYDPLSSSRVASILKFPDYDATSTPQDVKDLRSFLLEDILTQYQRVKNRPVGANNAYIIGDTVRYPELRQVGPGMYIRVNPTTTSAGTKVPADDLSYRNILGTIWNAYKPGGTTEAANTARIVGNSSSVPDALAPLISGRFPASQAARTKMITNINEALANARTPNTVQYGTELVPRTDYAYRKLQEFGVLPWFGNNPNPSKPVDGALYAALFDSPEWKSLTQDYPSEIRSLGDELKTKVAAGSADALKASDDLVRMVFFNERDRLGYQDTARNLLRPGSPYRTAVNRKLIQNAKVAAIPIAARAAYDLYNWWSNRDSGKKEKEYIPDKGITDSTPTPISTPKPTKQKDNSIPMPTPTPTPGLAIP